MADNCELSIVILSYNTKELLRDCLNSIKRCQGEISFETIVSDNASSDGSCEMIKNDFPWVNIFQGDNVGFAKGNNRVRNYIKGKMVLFLNPDTVLTKDVLKKTTDYLKNDEKIGAMSCKLILPSGEIDKDTRRRFPRPWISFLRLFLGNGRKYWYQDRDPNIVQEVDAIEGAFFLTWKSILDKVDWFDEDYFFNGEDLDLCWKIRKEGFKIVYYPEVFIYHLKGATSGKSKAWRPKTDKKHGLLIKMSTVDAMEIFFKKNLWNEYPLIFNWFVILGIRIFKLLRLINYKFFSK